VALPTTMSLGTRVIWFAPYQPPVPQPFSSAGPQVVPSAGGGGSPIPGNISGQAPPYAGMIGVGPFVGLCQSVGGAAPDFVGSTAVVFDARGVPFWVQLGVNITTWTSGGSLPGAAHWQFIDLSA
jgi:hypothetical protein